jgi:hypothetical protein
VKTLILPALLALFGCGPAAQPRVVFGPPRFAAEPVDPFFYSYSRAFARYCGVRDDVDLLRQLSDCDFDEHCERELCARMGSWK